jgi:hypothetical protein
MKEPPQLNQHLFLLDPSQLAAVEAFAEIRTSKAEQPARALSNLEGAGAVFANRAGARDREMELGGEIDGRENTSYPLVWDGGGSS